MRRCGVDGNPFLVDLGGLREGGRPHQHTKTQFRLADFNVSIYFRVDW